MRNYCRVAITFFVSHTHHKAIQAGREVHNLYKSVHRGEPVGFSVDQVLVLIGMASSRHSFHEFASYSNGQQPAVRECGRPLSSARTSHYGLICTLHSSTNCNGVSACNFMFRSSSKRISPTDTTETGLLVFLPSFVPRCRVA